MTNLGEWTWNWREREDWITAAITLLFWLTIIGMIYDIVKHFRMRKDPYWRKQNVRK